MSPSRTSGPGIIRPRPAAERPSGGPSLESRPIDAHPDRPAIDRPRAGGGLSIALCTYEGARWLPDLLGSLAAQTRLPDELVACDDGSSDDTVEILEAFAADAPFAVRVHRNPERLGSTRNFAAAVARCEGAIVALADQDDVWYPGKLAVLEWEFDMDPTVSMVFSDGDLIDADGAPLGRRLWDTRLIGRTLRHHPVVPEELFARRALTTGATMAVRRRVVDAAVPFPPELDDPDAPMRHDRWLSLVAAAVGTVRAISDPLVALRVHPDQETGVLVGAELPCPAPLGPAGAGAHAGARALRSGRPAAGRGVAPRRSATSARPLRCAPSPSTSRTAPRSAARARGRARSSGGRPGSYAGDPLAALAIAADVWRSVRHRTAGSTTRQAAS
ncbi:MAG: glycosyltransferase family 2 protein [Acidimicrobiales bacterium]